MSADSSHREIEIKLRIEDAAEGRRRLEAAGFQIASPRVFEANLVFDTQDGRLRASGALLRVRQAGQRSVLTFKGPAVFGRHKSREELEIDLSDAGVAAKILNRLGFQPVFRYEKYRTEFCHPGQAGLVTLDETPIGNYLELEGQPDWIDVTASRLGFTEADNITASYGSLYAEYRRAHQLTSRDMVFRGRNS